MQEVQCAHSGQRPAAKYSKLTLKRHRLLDRLSVTQPRNLVEVSAFGAPLPGWCERAQVDLGISCMLLEQRMYRSQVYVDLPGVRAVASASRPSAHIVKQRGQLTWSQSKSVLDEALLLLLMDRGRSAVVAVIIDRSSSSR
jgi:hypothetical protein